MNISVVIPCYNHGHLLGSKLDALRRQSVPPTEIIIVDDGSRVPVQCAGARVIRLDTNSGVPTALNVGISEARGDYLFLTALDDDILDDSLFFKAGCAFHTWPGAAFWTGRSAWMDTTSGVGWVAGDMGPGSRYFTPTETAHLLRQGRFAAQGNTCVWRRDKFVLYQPSHKWQHDWYSMHAMAVEHGFLYSPDVVGRFNIRRGSYCVAGRRTLAHEQALDALVGSVLKNETLAKALGDGRALMEFGLPMWAAARRAGKWDTLPNWFRAAKASARGLSAYFPAWFVGMMVKRLMQ